MSYKYGKHIYNISPKRYIGLLEEAYQETFSMYLQQNDELRELQKIAKTKNLTVQERDRLEQMAKHALKFWGKRVSKENQKLYNEILKEYEKLKTNAGECDYSIAVRIIAIKRRKPYKTLYPNFIRWKNNLYAKTT